MENRAYYEDGQPVEMLDSEYVKCDGCGNNMRFDPDRQMLYCEYCGGEKQLKKDQAKELDFLSASVETQDWQEETRVFRCENCGAKTILDKTQTASACVFCGSPHVISTEELPGIKPNAVLPFAFGEEEAKANYKKWAKKKLFCPSSFKKELAMRSIRGIYTPCWTFDSQVFSTYEGRVGERYTVTVGTGKNRHTEVRTRWFFIRGNYNQRYDDVQVDCGPHITSKIFEKLKPFHTNGGTQYNSGFLMGYSADHYNKDINTAFCIAKDKMIADMKRKIQDKHNADVVDYINVYPDFTAVTYKYVLIPVYTGAFQYKKKLYNVYMNGTNGKTTGKLPLSPIRITICTLIVLAIIGLILYFYVTGG